MRASWHLRLWLTVNIRFFLYERAFMPQSGTALPINCKWHLGRADEFSSKLTPSLEARFKAHPVTIAGRDKKCLSIKVDKMIEQNAQSTSVNGPNGQPLTLNDLPAPGIKRWVTRRKAEVVAAVKGGLLSKEDACARYSLSEEEFSGWLRLYADHGTKGLRATRLQQYRRHN